MNIELKNRWYSWGFLLLLLLLPSAEIKAQQEPLHTMYMYNGIAINPAYAGTKETLNATTYHSQQWVGLPGAPVTTSASVHSPVRFTNVGLGLNVVADQIGPVSDLYVNFFYAYRVNFKNNLTLSLGLSAGAYTYNVGLTSLSPDERRTYDVSINDFSRASMNGGTGAYLYNDRLFVGFAIPKLFQPNLQGYNLDALNLRRHYFWSAGYSFDLNEKYVLKPSFLSKFVQGAPLTHDINCQVFYEDMFSFGMSYRIQNSLAFMAGYHIDKKWMIGYSYWFATTELNQYSSGSHEIILSLDLKLTKSIVKSPRYYKSEMID